jgi:hypothetical protein
VATRRAIGEILVEMGVVTPQQIQEALRQQMCGDTRKLGEILVEMGFCATEDVTAALAEQAESDGMKVCLTKPELVDRRPNGQGGPSGRYLTTWRGEFEGGPPDRWWREAFAMWAGEVLQGICSFRITTAGYEFECGEDRIDDIMEKLVTAARKAEVTGDRNKAKDMHHENTQRLFLKVDELLAQAKAAEQEAERRKLQERMAKKFGNLEEESFFSAQVAISSDYPLEASAMTALNKDVQDSQDGTFLSCPSLLVSLEEANDVLRAMKESRLTGGAVLRVRASLVACFFSYPGPACGQ